jgi:hypothetical protein
VPVTLLTFLADASAVPTPNWSRADCGVATMQRLRHPFPMQPDRDNDHTVPGAPQ